MSGLVTLPASELATLELELETAARRRRRSPRRPAIAIAEMGDCSLPSAPPTTCHQFRPTAQRHSRTCMPSWAG